jgi:hypothetical protein
MCVDQFHDNCFPKLSTNIPKTHDFDDAHFMKAPLSKGSHPAETWSGRGLAAIKRRREKGMRLAVKGRIPEDSSGPTD